MANEAPAANWMSDVQRVLALVLVGTFAITLLILTMRLVVWGDAPTLVDLLKTLISALINVVMLVLGYFYGSSKGSDSKTDTQNKIMENLTTPPNGNGSAAVVAAAEAAAPAAAAVAAPPAVDAELDRRGITEPTTEPKT
jgi:hypothetical protein